MSQDSRRPRRIALAWHRLAGWVCFRIGAWERARRQFEQVVRLAGEDFDALVWMGRVAYKLGDYAGWKRECARARVSDPVRYARLRHPFELFEPRAAANADVRDGGLDPLGESRSSRRFQGDAENGDADANSDARRGAIARLRPFGALDGASAASIADDFSSEAERSRFRPFPPIDGGAIAQVDLDDLARRLIG